VTLAEIVAEVAPVLPLLAELPAEQRRCGDYESFEFRECFTVLTLLGRRLALLDLTPTTAVRVVQLAVSSVDGSGESREGAFGQHAVAAAVEGFVLGREERVAQLAQDRAAKPLKPLRIDDVAFALVLSGVHEPSVLSDCVDALGRAMLDADIEVAIVDLTQLGEPNRERAAAAFAADEVTKMLGGTCFFSGVDFRWKAAAADARIPLDAMRVVPNLAEAIAAARKASAIPGKRADLKWRTLLDRLRR
jgi:hypothetical protein